MATAACRTKTARRASKSSVVASSPPCVFGPSGRAHGRPLAVVVGHLRGEAHRRVDDVRRFKSDLNWRTSCPPRHVATGLGPAGEPTCRWLPLETAPASSSDAQPAARQPLLESADNVPPGPGDASHPGRHRERRAWRHRARHRGRAQAHQRRVRAQGVAAVRLERADNVPGPARAAPRRHRSRGRRPGNRRRSGRRSGDGRPASGARRGWLESANIGPGDVSGRGVHALTRGLVVGWSSAACSSTGCAASPCRSPGLRRPGVHVVPAARASSAVGVRVPGAACSRHAAPRRDDLEHPHRGER